MNNPIVPGWYADPESRVYNGKLYIYVTRSLPFEEQHDFDLIVSEDLTHFSVVSGILDTETFVGANYAIWAPTVIDRDGKYYIVFAANNIHEDGEPGGLYIGVSDTPEGKFRNVFPDGRPLINTFHNGAQPIDAHLFRDEKDGQIYLYYGGWQRLNVCRMNDDMNGFLPVPGYNGIAHAITPDDYVEAPFVAKFDDRYTILYSAGSWAEGTYHVNAARADSPYGPFTRYGCVLSSSPLADGPGHNSAFRWNGEWYIAYHRRIIGDAVDSHRVLCIDRLPIEDGKVLSVTMT